MNWKSYIPHSPNTITNTTPGEQLLAMIKQLQENVVVQKELVGGGGVTVTATGENGAIVSDDYKDSGPHDGNDPDGDGGNYNKQEMTLGIGDVNTLPAGSRATANVTGTFPDFMLNLGIPKGDKGARGDDGQGAGEFNAWEVTVITGVKSVTFETDGTSIKFQMVFTRSKITGKTTGEVTVSSLSDLSAPTNVARIDGTECGA